MSKGTRFTLYGWALCGTQLRGIAGRREKCEVASVKIRDRWLSITWPNTAKGAKAANAWSLANNVRSNAHLRGAM